MMAHKQLQKEVHKHHWEYEGVDDRRGFFCCSCRALVCVDVLSNGRGFAFAFRVLRRGTGVAAADLQALGEWCASLVAQPVLVHMSLRERRHKQRAKARR